jgi:hypothetical protein
MWIIFLQLSGDRGIFSFSEGPEQIKEPLHVRRVHLIAVLTLSQSGELTHMGTSLTMRSSPLGSCSDTAFTGGSWQGTRGGGQPL